MENRLLFLLLFIALVILIRWIAGQLDGDRIYTYVEERGGRVLSSSWSPFGAGWFGEKGERIYELSYVDAEGNEREATCKTSMFTGVYLTEDRIVRHAEPQSSDELDLEEENRRLRAKIEELERRA